MPEPDKKRLGNRGEEEALRHLKKRGYRILARNFATRQGEIDIIAEDRGMIAFVAIWRTQRGCKSQETSENCPRRTGLPPPLW
jgi:Holliday junction resolvase-like predicted endonuclease